jgi:hypothetical protein
MPVLLRPALHGALGPWDEILNLVPLVIGVVLFVYLYFTSRRRPAADDEPAPAPEDPPAPPA